MRPSEDTGPLEGRRLEAWAAAHRPRIWSTAHRILGDADLAEDIAQEALLRLHRNPPTAPDTRLGPWLHTVTVNLCRDALRARVRARSRAEAQANEAPSTLDAQRSHAPDPGRDVDRERASRAIRQALSRLPPAQAQAVRLRYLDGLSYAEIAERCDVAVGTVASRVFRGLHRLGLDMEPRHLEILK
jgi:RNA polymerase sigma-70 factor (ECF subfamily)